MATEFGCPPERPFLKFTAIVIQLSFAFVSETPLVLFLAF